MNIQITHNRIQLFLICALFTCFTQTSCMDQSSGAQSVQPSAQPAQSVAQEEQKKKAEISEETIKFWHEKVNIVLFPSDIMAEADGYKKPENAKKILNLAIALGKLSIAQNICSAFPFSQIAPDDGELLDICQFNRHENFPSMMELLIEQRINPSLYATSEVRFDPAEGLHRTMLTSCIANMQNKNIANVMNILLRHKADVHAKDSNGESVLTSQTLDDGAKYVNHEGLKYLLKAGINVAYVNPNSIAANFGGRKIIYRNTLSDYERLAINPAVKKIMDDHRAETAYQRSAKIYDAFNSMHNMPPAAQRIMCLYAADYPLMEKSPLPDGAITQKAQS